MTTKNPLDVRIITEPLGPLSQSPMKLGVISRANLTVRNDFRGTYTKNFNYKMDLTRGHVERTVHQNIKKPF